MEEEDVVIKHRGRRFKRSSVKSNGAMVVKPTHPPNDTPLQIQPNEQKGEIYDKLTCALKCVAPWSMY